MGGADSDPGYGAIGDDENGGDGVDVLLDMSYDIVIAKRFLLSTASVSQPRRLCLAIRNTSTHHYTWLGHCGGGGVELDLISSSETDRSSEWTEAK